MIGEVRPDGDLVAILSEALAAAGLSLGSADVRIVTQKIVVKGYREANVRGVYRSGYQSRVPDRRCW
jgi:hypothetical protein